MGMQRDFSSYVIADPCIGIKDATCVEVCPVDCIDTTDDSPQYFINPELCIVCEQCVLVCPVDAIYLEHEVPDGWTSSIERNASFFRTRATSSPSVSTSDLNAMLEGATARAAELGLSIAAAIVDRDGNMLGSSGSSLDAFQTQAIDRAYTSVMMERSTSNVTARMMEGLAAAIDQTRLTNEAGGIPFGHPFVTGAIGVSGGTAEQNHECARAALAPK